MRPPHKKSITVDLLAESPLVTCPLVPGFLNSQDFIESFEFRIDKKRGSKYFWLSFVSFHVQDRNEYATDSIR